MDRTAALGYLNEYYAPLCVALGLETTDTPAGWTGVLDRTWRTLGIPAGQPVPAGGEVQAEACLRYEGTRRLWTVAASKQDASSGEPSASSTRSQWFKQVESLYRVASAEAAGQGISVIETAAAVASVDAYTVQDPATWGAPPWP